MVQAVSDDTEDAKYSQLFCGAARPWYESLNESSMPLTLKTTSFTQSDLVVDSRCPS